MPSLRRQSDIQLLRKQGKFVYITHWLAISVKKNDCSELRWAWTLPKKVGNAVTRNRLKRWGRDFIREFYEKEIDVNFIFKVKKPEFYKNLDREEFNRALSKAFDVTP